MKRKLISVLACLLLAACANERNLEATVTAVDGKAGKDGKDGVSALCTVTQYDNGALLNCGAGGTAFVENGATGADGVAGATGETGAVGPIGPAGSSTAVMVEVTEYTGDTCTLLDGSTPARYIKKAGSNFEFFSEDTCHHSNKVAEISSGEQYAIPGGDLAVWNDSTIRVYNFN